MEGTVNYEGSGDVFFAFYNGNEQLTTMPQRGEDLSFERADCNNEASVEWDNASWAPTVTNLNKTKTKCTLYFTKSTSSDSKEYIQQLASSNNNNLIYDETDDNNLRFAGSDAQNFIDIGDKYKADIWYGYYSEDSTSYKEYNSQADCTSASSYNVNCKVGKKSGEPILWRIIGVMNNMTVINDDGSESTRQSLIKIIRADSIGRYSYSSSVDASNYGWGSSLWTSSAIIKLLNPDYDNYEGSLYFTYNSYKSGLVNNSLYWNSAKGNCYNDGNVKYTACDFSSKGLTESVKSKIAKVRWIYGKQSYGAESYGEVYTLYDNERNNSQSTWDGYIGLIFPTDYAFSIGGNYRVRCLGINMTKRSSSNKSYCSDNSWISQNPYMWTMLRTDNSSNQSTYYIVWYGQLEISYNDEARDIYPTAYLKSSVKIKSNTADNYGSKENPFQIE